MRKFGARVLAAIVASSLIVTPVMAAPSIDDLKEDKAEKQNEVNSLQEELTQIISKINGLEEDLVKKGEEIIQATDDLAAAEVKEKEQYEAMKLRIKYMYEEGNTSALESLVSAENFSDLVNKAEYVQNVHDYDRDQLQEYVETKNQIATLKTTLDTTIEEKRAEVADLDGQIQAAVEAAAREAEERRRKEEEERQRQLAAAGNNNSGNHQNNNGGTQNSGNSGNNGNGGGGGNNSTGNTTNNSNSNSNTNQSSGGTGNTSVAQAIVSAAYSQQGVPYVWGGTSPGTGLDCSGLVQYCHRVAGISVGRTSGAQGSGRGHINHVAIYIGGGQMIHAPQTGDVVKVASVYGSPWYRRYW